MVTPSFALRRSWTILNDRLRRTVTRALTERVAGYELKVPNDMTRVYQYIQRGDVVLVEGELRINQLVKYATQSPWSHSAFYVGDEMLRRGGRFREQAVAHFGKLADRLLVEALTHEGVVVAPLAKYEWHDIGKREDGKRAETHSAPPRRHYSQIVPRDFDLSPNFEIVKFRTAGSEAPK